MTVSHAAIIWLDARRHKTRMAICSGCWQQLYCLRRCQAAPVLRLCLLSHLFLQRNTTAVQSRLQDERGNASSVQILLPACLTSMAGYGLRLPLHLPTVSINVATKAIKWHI